VDPTATPEPTSESAKPTGLVLLEERCMVCHGLGQVERAQKSRNEWLSTVDRMIGKGAQLSEDEKGVLIDYLVETYGP
jgi:mono/diheme cytochrome c family protein